MELLAVLGIVLTVVTLVGHALWVVAAWILRGGKSAHDRGRYEPTIEEDRSAAFRYLDHLRIRGLMNPEDHNHFAQLISQDVQAAHPRSTGIKWSEYQRPAVSTRESRTSAQPFEQRTQDAAEKHRATPRSVSTHVHRESSEWTSPVVPPTLEPEPVEIILPPRRPLAEVLAGFMAEKNIRWGELVGGLLIVGCSIALVISLWSQIAAIPMLKFIIFTVVTAGLFGAGLFVHHRWKLPATGHALLVISTLLVPLNLLAFAAFSAPGAHSEYSLIAELAALALFGWLTFQAGRVLMPLMPVLFACGIAGLSACSLGVRFLSPGHASSLLAGSLLPVGAYAAVIAISVRKLANGPRMTEESARALILQLATLTFACLVPLGLLIYQSGDAGSTLRTLSPVLCLLAIPSNLVGIVVYRRLDENPAIRIAAAAISLTAAAVMILAACMAFPTPLRLVPTLVLNALAMMAMSRFFRHPAFHAGVMACLSLAWIVGFHSAIGNVAWSETLPQVVIGALLSATTGKAMVALVLTFLVIAEVLRRQSHSYASVYEMTAMTLGSISAGVVTLYGFGQTGDPQRVIWVYLLYAATSSLVAARSKSKTCTWGGCIMMQLALAQMLVYTWPLQSMPWTTSLLLGSSICAVTSIALWRGSEASLVMELGKPLAWFAIAAALCATFLLIALPPGAWDYGVASRVAWVAALWAALSLTNSWPALFAGAQAALFAAVFVGVHSYLRTLEWCQALARPIAEPWVWQAHAISMAMVGLAWALLRQMFSRSRVPAAGDTATEVLVRGTWRAAVHKLLNPSFPAVDIWVVGVAGLTCIGLALWAALPPVIIEHGSRQLATSGSLFAHAAGLGSWLLFFTLACIVALYHREGIRAAQSGLLVLAAVGVALLAAQWGPSHSVTGAWRWLSAGAFAVTSGFWMWQSRMTDSWGKRRLSSQLYRPFAFLLFVLPVVVLSGTFVMALARGTALVPPDASNLWIRFSLLGPCTLVALALIGYAIRDREVTFLLAAAGLLCASVTTVEVCLLHRAHIQLSAELGIWLVQLNIVLILTFAGVWRTIQQSYVGQTLPGFSRWPVRAARAALGAVLLLSAGMLWLAPQSISPMVAQTGSAWGIAALLLTGAYCFTAQREGAQSAAEMRLLPIFAAIAIACALAPWDTGNWLCFHALLVGLTLAGWAEWWIASMELRQLLGSGWRESFDTAAAKSEDESGGIRHDLTCVQCSYNLRGLLLAGRCPECDAPIANSVGSALERLSPQWTGALRRLRTRTAAGILACTVLVSAFAMRGLLNDPGRPWWSSASLLVAAAMCMTFAAWAPSIRLAYVAAVEVLLGITGWWFVRHWPGNRFAETGDYFELVHVNLIGLAVAGAAWMWLDRRLVLQRRSPTTGPHIPFHHAAAVFSTAVLCGMAGLYLHGAFVGIPVHASIILTWLAWGAVTSINAACLGRPAFRHAGVSLYMLGLAALAILAASLEVQPLTLAWSLSLALAGFVLLTSIALRLVWSLKLEWSLIREVEGWVTYANVTLMLVAVFLSGYTSLVCPDFSIRMLVVLPALACAVSAWLTSVGPQRQAMQEAALCMLSAAAILFSWSWVPPGITGSGLLRAVALFAATSALIPIFGWVAGRAAKRAADPTAIRHVASGIVVIAASALVFVARWEVVSLLHRTELPLTGLATIAMVASLGLLIITSISFALRPMLDPFQVVERARGMYVYVGEALAAVLALHVRASMPWLFTGVITQYWPILIMALAFAAVSVGEAFRRRGLQFLAQPLGRTGLFLPALTALEFFLSASRTPFWVVLTTAGAFYFVLAGLRRSATLAIVGGMCLTSALWYFLHQMPRLGIAQHPQLWFIPPAFAVLVAAHLNRGRLTDEQQSRLRYACLIAIYLSSTADIFLVGVVKAPWLPLVLGGLSVAGIFFGIGYRIRSFLQLGTGFLCLSLLTIIWHAATNLGWTWVWYVAGIVLGITIIAVFALFEKKRSEMVAVLENVRKWSK